MVQKKCKAYRAVILMGVFALLLNIVGCGKHVNSVNSSNSSASQVLFSKYSQEERKDYVHKYIVETYGVTCDISDVNKKTIGSGGIHLEDCYFAIATIDAKNYFNVWISDTGEIVDSYFAIEINSMINDYFFNSFSGLFNNYRVSSWISFENKPQKQWNTNDSIQEFLRSEPVCAHVNIFLDESEPLFEDTLALLCERIENIDVDIRLYRCPAISDFDKDTFEYGSCVFTKRIEKSE